jgi:hypothetical protein
MSEEKPTVNMTMPGLSLWALGYALRRGPALASAIATMLLKTGIELLKPWPMVFLIDYVLQQKEAPKLVKI